MSNIEQTLSIIKPDAVERNLDNEIKEMFKNKGFNIVKDKKIQITKSEAEQGLSCGFCTRKKINDPCLNYSAAQANETKQRIESPAPGRATA